MRVNDIEVFRAERDLVMFTYLRELRAERRRLALNRVAAPAVPTRLYSVWDEPAPIQRRNEWRYWTIRSYAGNPGMS